MRSDGKPAFVRRGLTLTSNHEEEESSGQRIEKSNPDRPAFLRKIMD
jgi:hypothetical protein